jgi:hypothetical protein
MKVWEEDYYSAKEATQEAYTILRSAKNDFSKLYVQYYDRYYEAMAKSIASSKEASESKATLDYDATFIVKPWLIENRVRSISGTGTISTTTRTLQDGGWTPTIIELSGTNITVSGYTQYGEFAGFISISGAVTDLIIDTENYTVKMNEVNRLDVMEDFNFETYIGPGVTYFAVNGATSCVIRWQNRWYL